jgi:hypothetical protein
LLGGGFVSTLGTWELDTRFVDNWLETLTPAQRVRVLGALNQLQMRGPQLGRPLVDRVHDSRIHNLKELRPMTSRSHQLRTLFVLDTSRRIVLLAAGNKSGVWDTWYRHQIAIAEENYDRYSTTY